MCMFWNAQPEEFSHCAEGNCGVKFHILSNFLPSYQARNWCLWFICSASPKEKRKKKGWPRPWYFVCVDIIPAPKGSATQAASVSGKSLPCIQSIPALVQYRGNLCLQAAPSLPYCWRLKTQWHPRESRSELLRERQWPSTERRKVNKYKRV